MTFTPNEAGIRNFLNSTTGPVGLYIARKAAEVEAQAVVNASGPILGIRSRELLGNLRVQMVGTPNGAQAHIGTSAQSSWRGAPFSYPAFWEDPSKFGSTERPRPWLTAALRAVFPKGA